ncbi:MAG: hypothetical protein KDK75_07070, partial [Alphaproteobacteria bacterium]|nr:hypothetical protein [Alphaproteobacteria bacterium]
AMRAEIEGETVLMSISTAEAGRAALKASFTMTPASAVSSGTQVKTTSTPPMSAGTADSTAKPNFASFPACSGRRARMRTSWPAALRRWQTGSPIFPAPIQAIFKPVMK